MDNDLIDRAKYRETLRIKVAEINAMLKSCDQQCDVQYITKQTGLRMAIAALDQVISELDSTPAADRLEALTAKSCPTCARSRECAAKPPWDGAAVINCPMWAGGGQ